MRLLPQPLKHFFLRVLDPPARILIRAGVSPNAITSIGLIPLVGAGVAFGFGFPRLGAASFMLAGVFDIIDGKVARGTGRITAFGAFYDSTLDRIGDAALFVGIAMYFITTTSPPWAVWGATAAMLALSSAMTVSYARARAEGLGLECKVGIAQRAERILVLAIPTLFVGAGNDGRILLTLVALLAFFSSITVVQRIVYVYRHAPREPMSTG